MPGSALYAVNAAENKTGEKPAQWRCLLVWRGRHSQSKICSMTDDGKCSGGSVSKGFREGQVGLQLQMEEVSLKRKHLNEYLKEVSEVDVWTKTVLGEETASAKALREECAWHVGGIARRTCDCHQTVYKCYYYIIII